MVNGIQCTLCLHVHVWLLHPSLHLNSQGQKRPHTVQHTKGVPLSQDRPVTMPLTPRGVSSPTSRTSKSPEALLRSSSSGSYHSASLYEETEDHVVAYSSNVEIPVPHTLVQSKKSGTKTSGNQYTPPKHQSGSRDSALSSSSSSPSKPTTKSHVSGSSGLHGVVGGGHSSGSLIQEFHNAVRVWNSERVERVLEKGVDVDMVINEKVYNVHGYIVVYLSPFDHFCAVAVPYNVH